MLFTGVERGSPQRGKHCSSTIKHTQQHQVRASLSLTLHTLRHSQDKTPPNGAHRGTTKCAYRLISLRKCSPAQHLHHKKVKRRSNTSNNILLKEQRAALMQDNTN